MKNKLYMIKEKLSALLIATMMLLPTFQASASSHREAPLIADDPLADNTDLYAFRSPDNPEMITIIANYIPLQLPHGGPNYYTFGQDIRYEIHIDNNISTFGDDIIYRFTFSRTDEDPSTFFNIRLGAQNIKMTYTCERSVDGGASFTTIITGGAVPPPNIGPRSINSGVGLGVSYQSLIDGAITSLPGGGKVYAGPADDPFFVDLGGIFDLGDAPRMGGVNHDGVACMNVHVIALQIPISSLQKDGLTAAMADDILDSDFVIGVWASASRPAMRTLNGDGTETASGDWIQVSRLGMPLTNEAVIPIGEKDYWNSLSPYAEDAAHFEYFYNPELGLYMDDDLFGGAVPGLAPLRIQKASLGAYDFTNGADGLYGLKGSPAVAGTALDDAIYGTLLLPAAGKPRSVDLWPIFFTGAPNFPPYQLATGKAGNPLAAGKPFINNFLPNGGDMLRLNMAVPVTPRNDPAFSSLGLVQAAVLGLTDPTYAATADLQWIPNMDGFPNGRRLEDDVTRIELQAVSGIVLAAIGLWYDDYDPLVDPSPVTTDLLDVYTYTTGVEANDTTFKAKFPYVQKPWSGAGKCSGLPVDYLAETDCGTPTDLNAVTVDATTVNLSWSGEEATSYRVDYRIVGVGPVVKVPSVANFTTLYGLTPCTNYEFRVTVKCVGAGETFTTAWMPFSTPCRLGTTTESMLEVYPNPASDKLQLNYFTSEAGSVSINVVDITGKIYIAQTTTATSGNNTFTLGLDNLESGVYFVQIKNGEKQVIDKFIVTK